VQIVALRRPEHPTCAGAGSDSPSYNGTTAEAAISQNFRRFCADTRQHASLPDVPHGLPPRLAPDARGTRRRLPIRVVFYRRSGSRGGVEVGTAESKNLLRKCN